LHFADNSLKCQLLVALFINLESNKKKSKPFYRTCKNLHRQDADCKPDSVVKNHLSGTGVAAGIQQLTQGLRPGKPQAPFV